MSCGGSGRQSIETRQICHPQIEVGVELRFDEMDVACETSTYFMFYDPKYSHQLTSFGNGMTALCPKDLVEFATYTINGTGYLAVVGCRNLTNSEQHEEGAWILVPSDNTTLVGLDEINRVVDEVLGQMPGLSATVSNFEVVDLSKGKVNPISTIFG